MHPTDGGSAVLRSRSYEVSYDLHTHVNLVVASAVQRTAKEET